MKFGILVWFVGPCMVPLLNPAWWNTQDGELLFLSIPTMDLLKRTSRHKQEVSLLGSP